MALHTKYKTAVLKWKELFPHDSTDWDADKNGLYKALRVQGLAYHQSEKSWHKPVILNTPVSKGRLVQGTNLMRRGTAEKPYSPVYMGQESTHEDRRKQAFKQASQHGFRAVSVDNVLYVWNGGAFHVWSNAHV